MSLDLDIQCEHCGNSNGSENITHNLIPLAKELGVYQICWRPEELNITAGDAIPVLKDALEKLRAGDYSRFDAKNGWGKAVHFADFLERVISKCEDFPAGRLVACR